MTDDIVTLKGGSLIQHGKLNDRIYLMKLYEADAESIIESLSALAKENNYSKIFCKVPKWAAPLFISDGYVTEAIIPQFYNGKEDVFFISKFTNSERRDNIEQSRLYDLSRLLYAQNEESNGGNKKSTSFTVRRLVENDIPVITEIYKEIFLSYPFPVHDPEYILKTMNDNVQYYGIEIEGRVVAVSSAETDMKSANAEMTDFAITQSFQGKNLSVLLLTEMEKEMRKQGFKTLYTIARLNSIPMNKTFLRLNYTYSGTLVKNTNIAGKIESMNVYYKHL